MTQVLNCGPLQRIDGPPPTAPAYGLLQAAEKPGAGIRIVVDADDPDERWLNGVEVYPYPTTAGGVIAPYNTGADIQTKLYGTEGTAIVNPQFGPVTVHVAVSCRMSKSMWSPGPDGPAAARAKAVLQAVESFQLAQEFLHGTQAPLNPFLSDGNGTFPNANVAVPVGLGISLLEDEIAKSGRIGLIHTSPLVAAESRQRYIVDNSSGLVRTITGNVLVPDAGYFGSATPAGHPAASGTQVWIYATGPVDIRRSEVILLPGKTSEALDRSLGATNGRSNVITWRAERYYTVIWDTAVHAAVLVDPCLKECGQ